MNDGPLPLSEGNLPEVYKERDSALLEASGFLYPRWRAEQVLTFAYYVNLGQQVAKDLHFLRAHDPTSAENYVKNQFDRERRYYEEHPVTPPGEGGRAFEEYHVSYVITDSELTDGIGLFYHVQEYVEAHHKLEPGTMDGGEMWAAFKYGRDILDELRKTRYMPKYRQNRAVQWADTFSSYSTGMMLAGMSSLIRGFDVKLELDARTHIFPQPEGSIGEMFNAKVTQRDAKLLVPYLSMVSSQFDELLGASSGE